MRIALVILAEASTTAGRVVPSLRVMVWGSASASTHSASTAARSSGAKSLRGVSTPSSDQAKITPTAINSQSAPGFASFMPASIAPRFPRLPKFIARP